MAREYFCAYFSYLSALQELDDAECGRVFRACLRYSLTGELPELCGNERFVFPSLRAQIDRDCESYERRCAVNRQNGSLGGKVTAPVRRRRRSNAPQGEDEDDEGEDKYKDGYEDECKNEYKDEYGDKDEGESSETAARGGAVKKNYTEYVRMTESEYAQLVERLGEEGAARSVEILGNYKASQGTRYRSDYHAILSWVTGRMEEEARLHPVLSRAGSASPLDAAEFERMQRVLKMVRG